eukprot:353751-Chlamydomonas_euryale.AAC.11
MPRPPRPRGTCAPAARAHLVLPHRADEVFDREPPVNRVLGVPSLRQLAANVVQPLLLNQVSHAERSPSAVRRLIPVTIVVDERGSSLISLNHSSFRSKMWTEGWPTG